MGTHPRAASTVYWEFSADRSEWQTLSSAPNPLPLDRVDIQIGTNRSDASSLLEVSWHNLDLGTAGP